MKTSTLTTSAAREELKNLETLITMLVCDVTARVPSREELDRLQKLYRIVGEKYDVMTMRWVPLEEGDGEPYQWVG